MFNGNALIHDDDLEAVAVEGEPLARRRLGHGWQVFQLYQGLEVRRKPSVVGFKQVNRTGQLLMNGKAQRRIIGRGWQTIRSLLVHHGGNRWRGSFLPATDDADDTRQTQQADADSPSSNAACDRHTFY